MNLDQIETLRRMKEEIRLFLKDEPISILKNEFSQFSTEVERALHAAVVDAYLSGELVRKSTVCAISTEKDKEEAKA